jgi:hypothetical protein
VVVGALQRKPPSRERFTRKPETESGSEAKYATPFRPMDTQGSTTSSKTPPVHLEMPRTVESFQVLPPFLEVATTLLLWSSWSQVATRWRGSSGSAATIVSVSWRRPSQLSASGVSREMIFGP